MAFPRLPAVEAVDLFILGGGDLGDVLAELDLGDHVALVVLIGHQLVHPAKDGFAPGGDQTLAHPEGVDLCPLEEEVLDDELVQGVGHGDGALGPSGLVQHLAGLLGEVGHVPGVQADAAFGDALGLEHVVEARMASGTPLSKVL